MSTKKFSIEEAIDFGWNMMINKFGTMMLYMFLPGVGLFVVGHVINFVAGIPFIHPHLEKVPIWYWPAQLVMWVIAIYFTLGIIRVALKLVDDKQPSWHDYASSLPNIFNYIGAAILLVIAVSFGILLFIVPGIILYIMFHLFKFLIADKNMSCIEALKKSAAITKGARWRLFFFGLLTTAINIIGLLCLIVGAIPACFVTFLAQAHVYRQLLKSSEATINSVM